MTIDEHHVRLMRYIDNEMEPEERLAFEEHLRGCDSCRGLLRDMSMVKEVTDTVKIADLPEAVWEKYWTKVYNRLERSVAWFLFVLGSLILTLYSLYKLVTDPGVDTVAGFGIVLLIVGFALLLLSVLREKLSVNRVDKYISEVKR